MISKRRHKEELHNQRLDNQYRELWDKVWDMEIKIEKLEKQIRKLEKKVK